MKIWQVWDGDYDGDWVVATYDSEELARNHAETFGLSRVDDFDVLSELAPEAADTALRDKRDRQREVELEKARRQNAERMEREKRDCEYRQAITIDQQHRPSLCHCRTFSSNSWFISTHGYCGYCGGWTPEVFRAALGDDALAAKINELDFHDRKKMRELCRLPAKESV